MGVMSPVVGNWIDRSIAWVITKLDVPLKSHRVIGEMLYIGSEWWSVNLASMKQWVELESMSA